MYKAFFKLTRDPFEISPDPHFLYVTSQHQEAVAGLYYGIKMHKGFMVLTGEVGTGKTLVIRCLQDLLDKNRVAFVYVFNSRLSRRQFLQYVAEDLGVSYRQEPKSDLLIQLSRFLIERHERGLTTVLVVDESQHLSPAVMEEIRLLTNLETSKGKLLQIVLVGQTELIAKLEAPAMRQLRQRVALWFRLRELQESETCEYVCCRLQLAGDKHAQIFNAAALRRVHQCSRGIPRLINTLCDNSLISSYALGKDTVTPELVDEAAEKVSRVFDALRRSGRNGASQSVNRPPADEQRRQDVLTSVESHALSFEQVKPMVCRPRPEDYVLATGGDHAEEQERFHILRHRLQQLRQGQRLSTVLVTSSIRKEGKTLVAINLASILARSSSRVLLLDADLRQSGIQRTLGLPSLPGLADFLEGRVELSATYGLLDPLGVYYLPAGRSTTNPTELLEKPGLQEVFKQAMNAFEWTVIDSAPLTPFVDARYLASLAHGTLLVVREGWTPREAAKQSLAALNGSYVAGIVMNSSSKPQLGYYDHYGNSPVPQAEGQNRSNWILRLLRLLPSSTS